MLNTKCYGFICPDALRIDSKIDDSVTFAGQGYRTDDPTKRLQYPMKVIVHNKPNQPVRYSTQYKLVQVGFIESDNPVKAIFSTIKFQNDGEISFTNVELEELKSFDLSEVVLEKVDAERWGLEIFRHEGMYDAEIRSVEAELARTIMDVRLFRATCGRCPRCVCREFRESVSYFIKIDPSVAMP